MAVEYLKYSCRQMAYDHEMWKLVDLIDIFSAHTDKRIVKYLSRRYVNEIESLNTPMHHNEISSAKVRSYLNRTTATTSNGEEDEVSSTTATSITTAGSSSTKNSEKERAMENEVEAAKPASINGLNETDPTSRRELITPQLVEQAIQVSFKKVLVDSKKIEF